MRPAYRPSGLVPRAPKRRSRLALPGLFVALACLLSLTHQAAVPVAFGGPGIMRRRLLEREPLPQEQLDVALAEPPHLDARNPCDALLRVPKVAILFMTSGPMPHERLWREWVAQAAGLLPLAAVRQYATDDGAAAGEAASRLAEVQRVCGGLAGSALAEPLGRQFLFTFYVHAPPTFRGYNETSLFRGTLIPHRTVAKRQQHSLIDAERLLLAEALRDPLNQRFLLLSDTTLPLYGPSLLYQQALAEPLSRMDACNFPPEVPGNLDRWDDRMETTIFKKHHWRKTSMWFSMPRKHAQLIVNDTEINEVFQKYCKKRHWHPITEKPASCSSCEHYPAIVLAVRGLAHESTCNGMGNSYVDWGIRIVNGHPRAFKSKEINGSLVVHARTAGDCTLQQTEDAMSAAALQFIDATSLAGGALALPLPEPPAYPALSANCSLFIRKMPRHTEKASFGVFRKFIRSGLPEERPALQMLL